MSVSLCPVDLAAVCTGHSQSQCQLDHGSDSCIPLCQYRFVPDVSVAVFQVPGSSVPGVSIPGSSVPGSRFQVPGVSVSVCHVGRRSATRPGRGLRQVI